MDVRVGTSGFSYAEWKGTFYPKAMKPAGMLPFYAGHFGTVEINNTFYRTPKLETVEAWAKSVPESFRFVLKATQRITYKKRLGDFAAAVAEFALVRDALGAKGGPTLFQLPPYMPKDVPALAAFLAALPAGMSPVVEFGDPAWFGDDTFDTLKTHGAALCIVDDATKSAPFVATANHGYLRLRRVEYRPKEIANWAKKIQDAPWESAWVFFKHEDAGTGPHLAKKLLAKL